MSELKKWKKKAWQAFSCYIRRRHANQDGFVDCVTCQRTAHWKEMQAGHFVDGRNNSVLFDDRLVYPQCPRCNIFLKGNKVKYTLFMMDKGYTRERIENLENLKHQTKRMTAADHREIYELYKEWVA